jgi:hypothetical protein
MKKKNREEGKQGRLSVAFEGTWVCGAAREKGGGSAWRRVGQEKEGEGPAPRSAARSDRQWPPAVGRGRRCCCVTGEGGGVRVTLARAGDRRDWATTGPSRQRLGAGGSERERGSVARGADQRARQHSAGRLCFKPIHTESKILQTVRMDSKFSKL